MNECATLTTSDDVDDLYAQFPRSPHQKLVEDQLDQANFYDWNGQDDARTSAALLCFSNRSGSTYLANRMAAFGLFCDKTVNNNFEYFNGPHLVKFYRENSCASFPSLMKSLISHYKSPRNIFGSKVSLDQLVWLTRAGVISHCFNKPRFFVVNRRNILAQAISYVIATQTSQWTSLKKQSGQEPAFDASQIAAYVRRFTISKALLEVFFTLHNIEPIEFIYEDMIADPPAVDRRLAEVTGIDPSGIAAAPLRLEKQATGLNRQWEKRFRALYPSFA